MFIRGPYRREDSLRRDLALAMSGRHRLAAQTKMGYLTERPASGGPLDGRVGRLGVQVATDAASLALKVDAASEVTSSAGMGMRVPDRRQTSQKFGRRLSAPPISCQATSKRSVAVWNDMAVSDASTWTRRFGR